MADRLRSLATGGELSDLRWPDYRNYVQRIQELYAITNYSPVWSRDGEPTRQALGVIAALESSQQKGLLPQDYDASLWPSHIAALHGAPSNADTVARFDMALTVSAMRYISDLHIGRVNPAQFKFDLDINHRTYDLVQFLSQRVLIAPGDMQAVLNEAEPQFDGYRRTEIALQHYLTFEAMDPGKPLPQVIKTLEPGDYYAGIAQLAQRLRLVGDLPPEAIVDTDTGIYDGAIVDAVKHYQVRHGLGGDGRLGKQTLQQLNIPLNFRVTQLEDALERWRWLPHDFPQPPIAVNIPEFVLRAFTKDRKVALRMNVVVGKAVRHQTPVFAQDMKYIVFRPYWNVPLSITRAEILPSIRKDRNYLARKDFEVTDLSGRLVTSGPVTQDQMAQMRSGKLLVRQKPGPTNSLGLVKFLFPNTHSVYLHDTPAPQLFAQSRRDFSHGCVRVEKPLELATWLLRDQPEWTETSIRQAMESGPDNRQVDLTKPVPVLIVYLTAVVEQNGEVHFFDDIYGHDRSLNAVLAKGRPYAN
ncbi:L,D-transpeptidase family protein [Acidipila rosea]|uniref:L,D-transpeptidase family protein n=1 Tax=Acidipila rosea TaxID=768535 RepID=UPI001404729E|nr:L,D-transpeptidase family protein [Acidipila rosea]